MAAGKTFDGRVAGGLERDRPAAARRHRIAGRRTFERHAGQRQDSMTPSNEAVPPVAPANSTVSPDMPRMPGAATVVPGDGVLRASQSAPGGVGGRIPLPWPLIATLARCWWSLPALVGDRHRRQVYAAWLSVAVAFFDALLPLGLNHISRARVAPCVAQVPLAAAVAVGADRLSAQWSCR